jgi:hypothetical protein
MLLALIMFWRLTFEKFIPSLLCPLSSYVLSKSNAMCTTESVRWKRDNTKAFPEIWNVVQFYVSQTSVFNLDEHKLS